MRPLRCSMRPGFQGRSKWNRSVQCAWKFSPSRAASVARRMRRGSRAGSALKRRWISRRRGAAGQAVYGLDALVGAVGALDRLLEHVAQVALRALAVLGEDEHPPVVPAGRGARGGLAERRQAGAQVRADPVDEAPGLGVGPAAGAVGDPLHAVEEPPLAFRQGRVGGGRRAGLGRAGQRLDVFVLLGLELPVFPPAPLVVGVGRGQERVVRLLPGRRRRGSRSAERQAAIRPVGGPAVVIGCAPPAGLRPAVSRVGGVPVLGIGAIPPADLRPAVSRRVGGGRPPLPLDRRAVHRQAARERFDRRE